MLHNIGTKVKNDEFSSEQHSPSAYVFKWGGFPNAPDIASPSYVWDRRFLNDVMLLAGCNNSGQLLSRAQMALNARLSSQASFTRVFLRMTGVTPGEHRRRRR